MAQTFQSGWENPDRHEPASERPRPMFDEAGKPVTQAPPPQPEVDPVLDVFRPGDVAARFNPGGPINSDTVTISKEQFRALALDAFADATRQTVERMVELAGPALGPAVELVGKRVLAELDES